MMDRKLEEKIHEKITETFSKNDEINTIVSSLRNLASDKNSFGYGIVIGRLYNSFYYQCRRILKRSPTDDEFLEFLNLIKKRESEFKEKLIF